MAEFLGKPDSSRWMGSGAQCDLVGWDLVCQRCPGRGTAWGTWGPLGMGYDALEKGQFLAVWMWDSGVRGHLASVL